MNILEEANFIIHGPRNDTYGHPAEDFGRTARLWAAILGAPVTAEQVALCMVAVKISRLCKTPGHRDSMVDVAGYIGTYEMVREPNTQHSAEAVTHDTVPDSSPWGK